MGRSEKITKLTSVCLLVLSDLVKTVIIGYSHVTLFGEIEAGMPLLTFCCFL